MNTTYYVYNLTKTDPGIPWGKQGGQPHYLTPPIMEIRTGTTLAAPSGHGGLEPPLVLPMLHESYKALRRLIEAYTKRWLDHEHVYLAVQQHPRAISTYDDRAREYGWTVLARLGVIGTNDPPPPSYSPVCIPTFDRFPFRIVERQDRMDRLLRSRSVILTPEDWREGVNVSDRLEALISAFDVTFGNPVIEAVEEK